MANNFNSKNHGYTCFWEIENFSFDESEKDLELISQTFSTNMMNKSRWYLKLKQDQNGCLTLMIFKKDVPPGHIKIHFRIALFKNSGWDTEMECKDKTFIAGGNGYGFPLIQNDISQKNEYLIDGSLIIGCHMWNDSIRKSAQCFMRSRLNRKKSLQHFPKMHFQGVKNSAWSIIYKYFSPLESPCLQLKSREFPKKQVKNKYTQTTSKETENTLNDPKDLLNSFVKSKLSYVTLRTPNKEFAVHKALLCATSPVFSTMFVKNMRENQLNIVDIDDIDNDTLTKLLQFLHQQSLGDLDWTMTTKLYYAADKYQIQQLKRECCVLLKNKLTIKNVCELLILSDIHQDTELKHYAQNYFCNHSKTILCSEEWKHLLLNKTELACDVLRTYAERS